MLHGSSICARDEQVSRSEVFCSSEPLLDSVISYVQHALMPHTFGTVLNHFRVMAGSRGIHTEQDAESLGEKGKTSVRNSNDGKERVGHPLITLARAMGVLLR